MTTVDRAALQYALEWLYVQYPKDTIHPKHGSKVGMLIDLLNERIATLPRTKMVEVWRVEYASNGLPCIVSFETRGGADGWVSGASGLAYIACIKVTGPHEQVVPAT
jgi:hypothetical protein